MQPLTVVIDLNELKDGSAGFVSGSEAFSGVDEFPFKRCPEAFDDRIIEARPFTGEAGADGLSCEFALVETAGILAASV